MLQLGHAEAAHRADDEAAEPDRDQGHDGAGGHEDASTSGCADHAGSGLQTRSPHSDVATSGNKFIAYLLVVPVSERQMQIDSKGLDNRQINLTSMKFTNES